MTIQLLHDAEVQSLLILYKTVSVLNQEIPVQCNRLS